jgi:hypothetical protein
MPKTAAQDERSVRRSTYKQDTCGPEARRHDVAVLEELIDRPFAGTSQTKALTDQAHFDPGYG